MVSLSVVQTQSLGKLYTMINIQRSALWIVVIAVGSLTLFFIAGLVLMWKATIAGHDLQLPYFGWLGTVLVIKIIGVYFIILRNALKYSPSVKTFKDNEACICHLYSMWKQASTVTIVTKRAMWLHDDKVVKWINELTNRGVKFEILVSEGCEIIQGRLPLAIVACNNSKDPMTRFTLINRGRTGAEIVLVAKGSYPDHEVIEYTSTNGPHVIGMAKEIVSGVLNGVC